MITRERSPRTTILAAIAAVLVLFSLAAPVLAAEEIRSYDSNSKLQTNGTVDVTETIIVNAEGDQIRHGIYRDIPTELINDDKSRLRSDLRVLDVTRDGASEPYTIDNIGSGYKRIKIGSADTYVDDGVHTYVIHYTMSRMGRFFADHDELYWNATGNFWVFPILKATAEITLPDGAAISGSAGYTGRVGSTEQAVSIDASGGKAASFASQRTLQPYEGMTIAVKFQKGILVEPSGLTKVGYWFSDHRTLLIPLIAALIVLAYNLWAWNTGGRDPRKGPIIPLFHPPEGLDPAQVHYVAGMGFKQNGWTALTASIFDLGVKGLVTNDKSGKSTTINATNAEPATALPIGESSIYNFIKSKGTVTIDKTDGPSLNGKRGQLVPEVKANSGETYIKNDVSNT